MAAVDLGSNSCHMVVARAQHGQPSIVDRLREMVRLASGLNRHGFLDHASQERALACLRRFGQRLRDMQAHQVRVVGTNTLRRARNAETFLKAAEKALGHPVEVISGIEEARLIYLGVSHHTDTAEGANLVVDIGGGSTELIIGEGYEPKHLESLSIGCVGVSQEAVEAIIAEMVEARHVEDLELPGLGPERAPVFAGGLAILAEVMSALRIQHMRISGGALREGLLHDMLGRLHDEDARERSIQSLQKRYHVD